MEACYARFSRRPRRRTRVRKLRQPRPRCIIRNDFRDTDPARDVRLARTRAIFTAFRMVGDQDGYACETTDRRSLSNGINASTTRRTVTQLQGWQPSGARPVGQQDTVVRNREERIRPRTRRGKAPRRPRPQMFGAGYCPNRPKTGRCRSHCTSGPADLDHRQDAASSAAVRAHAATHRVRKFARLRHRPREFLAGVQLVADRAENPAGWIHLDRDPRVGIEHRRRDPAEAVALRTSRATAPGPRAGRGCIVAASSKVHENTLLAPIAALPLRRAFQPVVGRAVIVGSGVEAIFGALDDATLAGAAAGERVDHRPRHRRGLEHPPRFAVVARLLEHTAQQLVRRNCPRVAERRDGIGGKIVEPQQAAMAAPRASAPG